MHTPQRQAYPGLLQHEETPDKEGYTVILWNVVITTAVEPKHPIEHTHVEKSIRVKIKGHLEQ